MTGLAVGRKRGLDLGFHITKSPDQFIFSATDLLVAMEPWQGEQLERLFQRTGAQITLLGLWLVRPRPHIEDPYGSQVDYFNICFALIDEAIQNIAKQIAGTHGS
jgi:protein-tyrosine phosphatase